MSYETLYRKYRPSKFSEVLGQDHIVDVLTSELKNNTISHAYLFAGPRGTGKTSIARILAREIGCSKEDLYEIDGASNRGIDEIRALKENIKTLPFKGDVKVYVIDEVHMLTKEAFNALLKTLEEPPPYVVFILATTELHKVPETIISRCQLFIFKKPTETVLKNMIKKIAKKEGKDITEDAASLISFLGEGSFRDVYTILEQILNVSSNKKIEQEDVVKITGVPQKEIIHMFINSALEGNAEEGIKAIHSAKEKNIDFKIYTMLIIKYVRLALLLNLSPSTKEIIKSDIGEDEFPFVENLSKSKNREFLLKFLNIMINSYKQISYSFIPELPLEIALSEMTNK